MDELFFDVKVRNSENKVVYNAYGIPKDTMMQAMELYKHYPEVTVTQSVKTEEKKQERYQAYEDLAFNTNRDELAQSCAEFLMSYCNQYPLCTDCVFKRKGKMEKEIYCAFRIYPKNWELKEGEPDA